MYSFIVYNKECKPTQEEKEEITQFLYKNLEEYGDEKRDILKCLNFAVQDSENAIGGFVLVLKDEATILGATIVNETGMEGYIPENILVYIAVDTNTRGKGIGKKYGCLTSLLDMLKIILPTIILKYYFPDQPFYLLTALTGILGHDYPIYHRFRGGGGESLILGA